MAHKCEQCGETCFCDGDQPELEQPEDCPHFTRVNACDARLTGDYEDERRG